jgi:enolase
MHKGDQGLGTPLLLSFCGIASVSETIRAIEVCREAGWGFIISHRAGETEDTFIADFAAMGGGRIQAGSLSRSERLAKYNRLLQIERETHAQSCK